jgi:hypothetical protein
VIFESFLPSARFQRDMTSSQPSKGHAGSCVASLDGCVGNGYSEETFQHFLAVERTRAERSARSLLLVLVSLRKCSKTGVQVPRAVSQTLLTALGVCVREVDFVGWYRADRVAGAVLAQGFDGPDSAAPSRIVERVRTILGERLPQPIAGRLRVRVVQIWPPRTY